jgi:hypothetical protein
MVWAGLRSSRCAYCARAIAERLLHQVHPVETGNYFSSGLFSQRSESNILAFRDSLDRGTLASTLHPDCVAPNYGPPERHRCPDPSVFYVKSAIKSLDGS